MIRRLKDGLFARILGRRFQAARACLPPVAEGETGLLSMLFPVSLIPDVSEGADSLIELALAAANEARTVDLRDVSDRIREGPRWPDVWPGEHYKLLAALVRRLRPKNVVEIGTFLGLSALTLRKFLPPDGRVTTFDLLPWDSFAATSLCKSDFEDGRLEQRLCDLADPAAFRAQESLLAGAELIFLDGPKNVVFERAFLRQLGSVRFAKPALLVIDDIRLWNMLDLWREIPGPKLDMTSFGHFSGTGLVRLGGR